MLTNARKAIASAIDSGDAQKMSDAGSQLAQSAAFFQSCSGV